MEDNNEKNKNYKQERRRFAFITYSLTAVFIIVSLLEWCLFYFVGGANSFFTRYYWVSCIFFGLGLILLVLFIFFEALRFNSWINWLFAVLILECAILGVAPLIVRHYKYQFLFSILIWTMVLALCILIGSFLPVSWDQNVQCFIMYILFLPKLDLTLDVVVLFVLAMVTIIGAVYFVMIYIVTNAPYSFIIARVFIVISIWMFVMYHAQIINGGRFAEMRTQDYFLGAIILYLDFLLMYLFSFHLASKWSDLCDLELNLSQKFVVFKDPTTTESD
ncbi:hypothetical protein KR009_000141 [Drosophila setifemur]|nr:hypothetical protein KR009_000141 [Drosophila setifemur]